MGHTTATDDDPARLRSDDATPAVGRPRHTDRYDVWVPACRSILADSFDAERHLFSHQLLDGRWREVDEIYPHETLTSSCIALLGLARSGVDASTLGVDTGRVVDAVASEVIRTGYRGGLGLGLWANAVVDARDSTGFLHRAGTDLDSLVRDLVPTFTTMETAWCASGLLHEYARSGDAAVGEAAQATVDELRTNRWSDSTRLMRHAGPGASALHRARGHIANFADQIYSVQAFAFASIVLDDRAAFGAGTRLAEHHCELQGDRGQWWWHYDADRGHVALRYAVYSVHQHGMAPMALCAVEDAGGGDYSSSIAASVRWIDDNESGSSMFDTERGTPWRSLERVEPSIASRMRGVLEALGTSDGRHARVTLNRETRPYEWAWCMYAAAIDAGLPKGASLV